MDKTILLKVIVQISHIIIDNCETDKDVEQVREGIGKYIDFLKSIPQI